MSDGIRVKVLPKEELEKRYYLPSKRELKILLQDAGFLPPDAEELAQLQAERVGFLATPEGRLACIYAFFYPDGGKICSRFSKVLTEEEGGVFYSNKRFESDDFPVTALPPRYAKNSNTTLLTSGLENLLAIHTMTERSYTFAVPHAGMAVRSSDVLSRLLKDAEIKKVVLAFPKSQKAYQTKLARLLKQDGFQVEELSYDGKSPFHHYQISVNRMLQEAAMEYDSLIPDNGV